MTYENQKRPLKCELEASLSAATAMLPLFKTLTLMRSQDAGDVYDASSVDDIADQLATALSTEPAAETRAYEALVQQVAELTAERDSARTGREGFARANETEICSCEEAVALRARVAELGKDLDANGEAFASLYAAVQTERAAREAADRELSEVKARLEIGNLEDAEWHAESAALRARYEDESRTVTVLQARVAELESPPCGCVAVGRLVTVCDAHRERDALRAQVAELEKRCAAYERMARDLDEWKCAGATEKAAREAAEKARVDERIEANEAMTQQWELHASYIERAQHAESEAATLRAKLERVEAELRVAEARFRNRDNGGVICGEFYDRVKEILRTARGAR